MGCSGSVRDALCQQGQGGQQAAPSGSAVWTDLCSADVVSLQLLHETKQQHRQGGSPVAKHEWSTNDRLNRKCSD